MADTAQNTQSALQHFTSQGFDEMLKAAGDKPVFVDFYAEWCGPCRLAAPIIAELAEKYKDSVVVGKLDVDEAEDGFSRSQGVMSIPTVKVFKAGKEVDKVIGFPGKEKYVEMIENALKK